MIKVFYLPQGLVIGDVTENDKNEAIVKNPALIIARANDVLLAPLLNLVEEKEIKIKLSEIPFNSLFTPKRELLNHYNQIYGSGIVLSSSLSKT